MTDASTPATAHVRWPALRTVLAALARDRMLQALLLVLALLTALDPAAAAHYPSLVDWPTIAALTGLLALTHAIEASAGLHHLAHWLLARLDTQRSTALALVSASALLSTVLTNDVALFVMVPLTLGVCRAARLPSTRLVVFEALAVNAGSMLTPIGNPQNLFLWQRSGVSFAHFAWQMAPLVAVLMASLLVVAWWAFPPRPVRSHDTSAPPRLDRVLLATALALYAPFLLLADLQQTGWALALVAVPLLVLRRRILLGIDWGLLLVFVLMFVDLRLIASLAPVRTLLHGLGLDHAGTLYWAAVGASQLVSNVPATIALAQYTSEWRALAYGANVGGFGLALGSLANLIALRLSGDARAWRSFHAWSLPFGLLSALLGWWLL